MARRSTQPKVGWKGFRLSLRRKNFRARSRGAITAVDVDGQILRVVQTALRSSGATVTRIAAARLELPGDTGHSDPAIMGAAIAKALTRMRIRPSQVVMGIPRAQMMLRTLSLPAIEDLRELASMVHYQVGRDLPFRLEEAVIDFKVRPQPGQTASLSSRKEGTEDSADAAGDSAPVTPKVEVLVAAVKREVVDFHEQMATAAGLKLTALGLRSYANVRCVEACRVAEGNEAIAMISFRPDEVIIDVLVNQALVFSRGVTIKPHADDAAGEAETEPAPPRANAETVPVESPAAAEELDFVNTVIIEVVRTLHSYSGVEPNSPIAKVVVAGATGHEPAGVAALQARLSVPCSLLDPARALRLPESEHEHAAGSIAAIGLGLGVNDPQGLPFDFLNPKRPAVQRDMRRIKIVAGAATAALVLVAVLGARHHLTQKRMAVYQQVQQQLTEAEKKRPIYRQMRMQAATIQGWAKEGRNWLAHYTYLSAILPNSEEIYITTLSVNSQGGIHLSVQARSGEILAKLDKQLRAAGYDVKPLAITPGTDRHGYSFRSNVELSVSDTMKIDLAKLQPPARPADDASLDPQVHRKGGGP